jgi:hypothetical protein
MASSFLMYWAGLQKPEDKLNLEAGAAAMKETVLHFHAQFAFAPPKDNRVIMLH